MSGSLNPVAHEMWCALRFVGLRDCMRCPKCSAVGTWKPHGGWWDRWRFDDRPVRRWMCKWCGHYIGPEGVLVAFPNLTKGCWDLTSDEAPFETPQAVIRRELGNIWPGRG